MNNKFSIARTIAIVLGILIIALAFTFSARAQSSLSTGSLLFKKGTEAWFTVTKGEETLNLTVTVVSQKPQLVVNWKTDGDKPRSGTTTVLQESMEDIRRRTDDFTDGVTSVKSNFLWFSKGMFDELTVGKTMYSKDDNPKLYGLANAGKEQIEISVNGKPKKLEVIHAVSVTSGSNDEYWILNDTNNPLILKAVLSNATIEIKQLKL